MSNKLTVEVDKENTGLEKEEPKEDIELEDEGIPRGFRRSEEYRRGYKAGWLVAKKNILKKLSQSGQPIEQKSTEDKVVGKKKSKKDEEVSLLTWAIIGLVLGGITLFVILNEYNRKRSQSVS